jgi:hypothetical protein
VFEPWISALAVVGGTEVITFKTTPKSSGSEGDGDQPAAAALTRMKCSNCS